MLETICLRRGCLRSLSPGERNDAAHWARRLDAGMVVVVVGMACTAEGESSLLIRSRRRGSM